MRKSERLFQLVTLLQGRRTVMTGQALADALGVAVRTVYRDIQALILSGVPIDGEAGVGYRLRKGFDLPPLMFEMDEVTALLAGNRMVQAWTDPELAEAARRAEAKILAVLTPAMLNEISRLPYRVPIYSNPERETHGLLRKACELRLKVKIAYRDMKEQESERTLWPLGMVGWGDHWTLLAWCELRDEYRNFRFDRIQHIECLPEHFPHHPERNLEHYLTKIVGVEDAQKPA
ncbi:MAG TPA: YafY family transcriptional regulator [Gallionellaceae bacterium]|nr:YafY family transcriptional regulator [Gallionellaceae bacterium]